MTVSDQQPDISGNLTLVDSLTDASSPFDDMDGMQFDTMSVDTSIASGCC